MTSDFTFLLTCIPGYIRGCFFDFFHETYQTIIDHDYRTRYNYLGISMCPRTYQNPNSVQILINTRAFRGGPPAGGCCRTENYIIYEVITMGWTIGIPSLKLNNTGSKSKHCGSFAAVAAEALEERQGHDPDINRELAEKNIYEGYQTAAELMAYSEEHCEDLRDAKGRRLRNDAVRMCATIFKPPAAYMATLSEEDQLKFLRDGVAKIEEIVGTGNVKSKAYHFDELGGHVHVFWEPMTDDGRLCAKEKHNLAFFRRLNKEMPAHLRGRGWDIDDCNAYDQAEEERKTEKEKAEERRRNGRSSAVYKAEAQRELNELNERIDTMKETIELIRLDLEGRLTEFADDVADEVTDIVAEEYPDVMFLISECSEERFEELAAEGKALMRERLAEEAAEEMQDLEAQIFKADSAAGKQLTWEQRNAIWEQYKAMSDTFWEDRRQMAEDTEFYLRMYGAEQYRARKAYYEAKSWVRSSRSLLSIIIAVIYSCIAKARLEAAEEKLSLFREERKELIRTTSSFAKYSKAVRESLKEGKMPEEKSYEAMRQLVMMLDEEYERSCGKGYDERKKVREEKEQLGVVDER